MAFIWLKQKIKGSLPESALLALRNFLNKLRAPPLFDDDQFLSYVLKKKLGIEKNKNNIRTLALRGSIADYGFYPIDPTSDYNLGLTSSDLYTAYHLYLRYRVELKKLSRVVVYINPASIGFSLIKTRERYRAVAYKYYFGVPYQEEGQIKRRDEKIILRRCGKIDNPIIDDVYCGFEEKKGISADAAARAEAHLRESRREPDQLSWLVALYDAVAEDSRSLYVVIAPARRDYKNHLPSPDVLFKKIYALSGMRFYLLDFYDSTEIDDSHMADTDHLNTAGSIVLTNILMKKIIENY